MIGIKKEEIPPVVTEQIIKVCKTWEPICLTGMW